MSTPRQQILQFLLKALLAADGEPMPEDALIICAMSAVFPRPSRAEVGTAMELLETDKFISGVTDRITGKSWSLTTAGKHRAQTL